MSSYTVAQLLEKMKHADQDFRYMALQDLQGELKKPNFSMDGSTEERTVEQVLALMKDNNTEVKNHAVKTIGVLSTRVQESRITTIINQLTVYTSDKDEQLRDIANLGLRTVIRDVPVDPKFGELVCTKLAPKLLEQLQTKDASPDTQLGCTELLSDLFSRFEPYVRNQSDLQQKASKALVPLLKSPRPAVRKRAVEALGFLSACATDDVVNDLLSKTVVPELSASDIERLKIGTGLVGALAGRAPTKLGSRLSELMPKVIKATTAKDDDDLREAGLQALERVVLKCPREVGSFVPQIIELATTLIKHDPNYEGMEEQDEEMNGADEEEDEDFEADYEDDDDVSWKVRRSATKVFAALIETRPELLGTFFRSVSPVLISRLGEREESVRIEIWQTYIKLLQLAKVYGEAPPVQEAATLKRKRDQRDMRASPMDVDENPATMLRQQAPSLLNGLIKQLANKSQPARLAGFALLRSLIEILRGGIEDHVSVLLARTDAAFVAADSGASGSATALKIEILAFLDHFFALHPVSAYQAHLSKSIVPRLTKAMVDKYNKVAAEAFSASASLVRELRPVPPQDEIPSDIAEALRAVYDATINRLAPGAVSDQDVREAALSCLGDLLYHAGDALAPDYERSLSLLRAAIQRETTRLVAVRVAGHISQSPACSENETFAAWIRETLGDVASLLRQINRSIRLEAFGALPHMIAAAGSALDADTSANILASVQPYLSEDDAHLVPSALGVATALLIAQPSVAKSTPFTQEIMTRVHTLAASPVVHSAALDALLQFFEALVSSGVDAKKLANELINAGSSAPTANAPKPAYANIARCLGAVIGQDAKLASSQAKVLVKAVDQTKSQVFALLALGHLGRIPKLPERAKAFDKAHALFDSQAEDVRLAAAFAVGNLAVGAPDQFLPVLVEQIEQAEGDDRARTLALASVKEFIVHTAASVLAPSADALWDPLLAICAVAGPPSAEAKPPTLTPEEVKARDKRVDEAWKATEPIREQWKATEVSRTMAAECLGKITLANPPRYLPKLQARLTDKLAGVRAAAVSAVRFTFTDESAALDEPLAAAFPSFMSLMRDVDLDVRRLALNTLNSAAHHKTQLVRPHLPSLLPLLFAEMAPDQSLIRIVEMGPFKHKVDDGLDARKAAYETSYTLLDTCLAKLDTHELLTRVIAGMSDDNEIRAISYLMLVRLAAVAPTTVVQHLFGKTLTEELKADAVKQDQEKHRQGQRAALRAFAALSKLASPANAPKFAAKVTEISNNATWGAEFKQLRSESAVNGDAMDIDG